MNQTAVDPVNAANPDTHAAVIASAGTGKTWLLVTRIIRLLLSGAAPENILAITFARKAAAEMQSRLRERLFLLASCDKDRLESELQSIGLQADEGLIAQARSLYQSLLMNPYPLRTTTFHAFCQELLKRFPLEADVSAGFDLLESTQQLEQEALDALFNEASLSPDSPAAQALESLLERCGTLASLQSALREFLQHRSDWWAFTQDKRDPVDFAQQQLLDVLQISTITDSYDGFPDANTVSELNAFAELLRKHPVKTNMADADTIDLALGSEHPSETIFHNIRSVFLKKDDAPRSRKPSKTLKDKLGEAGQARLLELHDTIGDKLCSILNIAKRQATWLFSCAWYMAGNRYLEHYQRIKNELRCLDFSDLEWHACRLLNNSDNSHWIQYKLDQKIHHLLVDEFQDTNPTQWQLLFPVLTELAASDNEQRSAFIVGDSKQSIYSFRRANPQLLSSASKWMAEHLQSTTYDLDKSRRSSKAIMDVINSVFSTDCMKQMMPEFHHHDTWRDQDWGVVEILPPVPYSHPEQSDITNELRDPLSQPRQETREDTYYIDGCRIAEKIFVLMEDRPIVHVGDTKRPLEYSDILILIRNRTHVASYEQALQDHGIPYVGTGKGTLLGSLEIQDMLALLGILITPYDDLSLVQVLRSPLFCATDQELMQLAGADGKTWMEKLKACADAYPEIYLYKYAFDKLSRWQALADRLPVHDLLDHIYFEADVVDRYLQVFPAHLHPRVSTNLRRFIELALDIDSGRYPSISAFTGRLAAMKVLQDDTADTPISDAGTPHVRIMTIHASKGLESPVVFLVDAANIAAHRGTFHTIFDWPADATTPSCFMITGKADERDDISNQLMSNMNQLREREEYNLLYVALTRARQMLVISACEPHRGIKDNSWYSLIREGMKSLANETDVGEMVHSHLKPESYDKTGIPAHESTHFPDIQGLSKPIFKHGEDGKDITPSATSALDHETISDEHHRLRGQVIHRMIQLLSDGLPENITANSVTSQFSLSGQDFTRECMATAKAIVTKPEFDFIFDTNKFETAYNEQSLQYSQNESTIYGYPDRVVVTADEVLVIDYKTHVNANKQNLEELSAPHLHQMKFYAEGIKRIWPDKKIRLILLFTSCTALYEIKV